MKRFNFGTFLVDDTNRRAFQICQDIAELKPVSPLPVVLLGDEGCGKTHLLYSIVNRIRAGTSKTGLAYVTALDFPDQVRHLIDDPTLVERAQSAVLLVDQLERFRDLIEELEAVVRIFLDNNHYVVLATKVHPGRLQHLPSAFRTVIETGQIVQIVPRATESQIETIKRQLREESDALLARKQQEIEDLRALLSRVGKETSPEAPANVAALRAELDAERIARADTIRKLSDAREQIEGANEELVAARTEIERLRSTVREVEGDFRAAVESELAAARERAERSEREAEALRDELDRIGAEAARVQELERLADSLRDELDQARVEAAENLDTARELHEQLEQVQADAAKHYINADAANEQIEAARTDAAVARERVEALSGELEALQARFNTLSAEYANSQDALSEARDRDVQLESELIDVRAQAESLLAEREQARGEAAALREQLQRLEDELAAMQSVRAEAERLQSELETTQAEAGAARDEASRLREELERVMEGARAWEARAEALVIERDDARIANAALADRGQRLLSQFEALRSHAAEQSEQHRREIEDLEAVLDSYLSTFDPETLTRAKEQADQAVAQIESMRAEFELERSELEAARSADRERMQAQLDALLEKVGQAESAREQTALQQHRLEEQLAAAASDRDEFRRAAEDLGRARENVERLLDEARQEIDSLRDSLKQSNEQRLKAQSESARHRAERDAERARLESVEAALAERERAYEALKQSAAQEVASAKARASELEGKVARLETECQALREAGRQAREKLDATMASLSSIARGIVSTAESGAGDAASHESGEFHSATMDAVVPPHRGMASTSRYGDSESPHTPRKQRGSQPVTLRPLDDLEPLEDDTRDHTI